MPRSSDAAIALIVREEVSDAPYYARHYLHCEWPEGASGVTVGIGYDLGYVTAAELRADWSGIVAEATISNMLSARGRQGEAAHAWVQHYCASITIPFETAMLQFKLREVPKWEVRVMAALPNTDKLPPDCFGVLVSLSYNRGCSYDLPGARYAEMRSIKAAMARQDFAEIPKQLRLMARLWTGGVAARREHEARLFERGLQGMVATVASLQPAAPVDIAIPATADALAPSTEPPPPPLEDDAPVDDAHTRPPVTARDLRGSSRTVAEQMMVQAQSFMQAIMSFFAIVTAFVAAVFQPIADALKAIGPEAILIVFGVIALALGIVALVRAARTVAYRVEDQNTGRHTGAPRAAG